MIKAILISHQGAGTNLLRSFLNSHPDIVFEDELFCLDRNFNQFKKSNKSISDFLDSFFAHYPDKQVVGFDLKYNQIEPDILKYIRKNKLKVIHLRRNAGRTFLRQVNEVNTNFSYFQLCDHCELIYNEGNKIDKFIKKNNLECLDITYEEMTLGRKITNLPFSFEYKLLNFFGIYNFIFSLTDKFINKELKIRY